MDLLRPLFEDAGIEYEVIKIHALFSPYLHQELKICSHNIISSLVITLMRWYTQNVAVKIRKDGNKEYEKKEPIRRKTDGFKLLYMHCIEQMI